MNQKYPADNLRFVIDANILLKFSQYTPPKIHKRFWQQLKRTILDGKVIIIQDVAEECRSLFIKEWVDNLWSSKNIVKVEDYIRASALEINNKYRMTIRKNSSGKLSSKADPVIVAYAKEYKYTVFTDEKDNQLGGGKTLTSLINSNERLKIPAACRAEKVNFTDDLSQVLLLIMEPIE